MKKILTSGFLSLLILLGVAVPFAARADTLSSQLDPNGSILNSAINGTSVNTPSADSLTNSATPFQTGASVNGVVGDPTGLNNVAPSVNVGAGADSVLSADQAAAESKPINPPVTTKDTEYGWVMEKIMRLAAWLLGMAAITLDNAVYYTVVHMGAIVGGTGSLAAIGVTWGVLRDLGNIILIFGFIALGINTILQSDFYGGGAKMIPKLLLAAVLINFSLFISEAVIDGGNLFATQFYTQINNGQPVAPMTYGQVDQEGISNAIMGKLGLQAIYGDALKPNTEIFTAGNVWIVGAFGTLLFLIATFVFFSLAFILIARFIILTLLIIVAPIGFAGMAVPKLQGVANQWWQMLLKQTITAPVLLLLLYVALSVITDASFLTGFGGGNQLGWLAFIGQTGGSGLSTTAGMLLSFFIAMGLLLAVTMVANNLSAFGAGAATKWGSRLSGLGLVAAGTGLAARTSVGGAGHWLGGRIGRTAPGRTFVGRAIADRLQNGVGKASFDFRNTDFINDASKKTGLNLGKGQKGGYQQDLKDSVKSYENAAGRIIDRPMTADEKRQIAEAQRKHEEAETRQQTAADAHAQAQSEIEAHTAEVERLQEEKRQDKYFEMDKAKVQQLSDAEAKLAKGTSKLASAEAELAEATSAAATRKKERDDVTTTVTDAASAKGQKIAYGERLEKGYVPFVKFAAQTKAGKSIKDTAGKSKEMKLAEKLLQGAEKESSDKKE